MRLELGLENWEQEKGHLNTLKQHVGLFQLEDTQNEGPLPFLLVLCYFCYTFIMFPFKSKVARGCSVWM